MSSALGILYNWILDLKCIRRSIDSGQFLFGLFPLKDKLQLSFILDSDHVAYNHKREGGKGGGWGYEGPVTAS